MKRKILFVCLGNICRSPLAEAIFENKLQDHFLQEVWTGDSCGTAGHHQGESPDIRTIRNARKNGIEIRHKARQLRLEDFQKFDLILAMDQQNYRHTKELAGRNGHHQADIRLMRTFDPEARHPEEDVPDPWYGGEEGFEAVFQILNRSCDGLIRHLEQEFNIQNRS